ncbi:fructan beta-fructosidase [Paraburkholderia fungorum]|uniref:Fructan beta-fructosidase n=1 Tax=Paraburkholderia fungorum TaxID=134537 RepID=A0A1H1A074_9BURK|nr:glycoside hydrolase family 32 protein [Paraburkholderia fungorum]SDQ33043.1 fructan beta-fructosidase [Paraburkholderia fungorum]
MKKLLAIAFLGLSLFSSITPAAQDRPDYHFTPHSGWINDPNGLIESGGVYHLFYQFYDGGWALKDGRFKSSTEWGPMHWGHATSTDLVHWHQMPIALYPDKKIGTSEVQGMIFSGSVVLDRDNTSGLGSKQRPPMVAVYTEADTFGPGSGQRQAIAYSVDNGTVWKKYAGNPVLPYNNTETFRDPQVFWFGAANKWVMVISCGDRVCFYNSPDLKHWAEVGDFGKAEVGVGVPWECPDLFPLQVTHDGKTETKWVLVVSVQHGAPTGSFGTRYFVGDFDGKTFKNSALPSDVKWLDYGSDYYAGRTWTPSRSDLKHRIALGWMANWSYAKTLPTTRYRGSMTVPRELSLQYDGSGYYLAQRPVPSVQKRLNSHKIDVRIDDSHKSQSITTGTVAQINVDFKITPGSNKLEFELFKTGQQQVSIAYDVTKSEISVDRRNYAGYRFKTDDSPQSAHVVPQNGHLTIQALLDRNSVELFVNDGRVTFTNLIYPEDTLTQTSVISATGSRLPVSPAQKSSALAP